jgi:hypothetical protein
MGEGRAWRYLRAGALSGGGASAMGADDFPAFIPISANTLDIVDQSDEAGRRAGTGCPRTPEAARSCAARYGVSPSGYTTWKAVQGH